MREGVKVTCEASFNAVDKGEENIAVDEDGLAVVANSVVNEDGLEVVGKDVVDEDGLEVV